jgi:Protein of unknown function (DUF3142)
MIGKVAMAGFGCVAAAGLCWLEWSRPMERATGPMPQEVYVWQRAWTEPVFASVVGEATNFTRIVALAAEVSWEHGEPKLVRAPLNYEALLLSHRPVGLALRIGAFGGPFAVDDDRARWLGALARSLVEEAENRQLKVAELQIDFDCAESKLAGYTLWVERIRREVAPRPLVLTALPSWLKCSAMGPLVCAADGYVLQVHSLNRPGQIQERLTLCDPMAAREAVERAARLGRPFRVALPTYGYLTAFDAGGKFVGVSAEGPLLKWPEGTQTREVRADPVALSGLIREWTRDRPKWMQGVIWYRLPVRGERWNWPWPTLKAVMSGQPPRASLRAQLRHPDPGLIEVDVANVGTADRTSPVQMEVSWQGARRVAGDALQGFDFVESANTALQFKSNAEFGRLQAGETRSVGWLRFDKEVEVSVEWQ